jgi:hypothetical protein
VNVRERSSANPGDIAMQSNLICVPTLAIVKARPADQNGGAARVLKEQAKSQKVTLSLAAMRPDRRIGVNSLGSAEVHS